MIKTTNFIIKIEKDLDTIVNYGIQFQNALSNPEIAKRYMQTSQLFTVFDNTQKLQYIGELRDTQIIQLKGPKNKYNYTSAQYVEIQDALLAVGLLNP